jgi:hypothetical protein
MCGITCEPVNMCGITCEPVSMCGITCEPVNMCGITCEAFVINIGEILFTIRQTEYII